jgi:hypothetical protein
MIDIDDDKHNVVTIDQLEELFNLYDTSNRSTTDGRHFQGVQDAVKPTIETIDAFKKLTWNVALN